jgi:6-pyruvoyltetrahydropterin/6-carboxytetrahydropterin synthase
VGIARLTRTVRFSAAHRYYRPEWTDEENHAAFGACANEPGHGHNYSCAVTIAGPLSDDRSMIMDLTDLDRILAEEIVDRLDHQHINEVVSDFAYGRSIPTAEAMAGYLWGRVAGRLPPGVELFSVKVQEDTALFAEYFGNDR